LGHFNIETDLFLAHFDSKTDVDDIHSIAAIGTLLSSPTFANVQYHAVAGAYGRQSGLYVPAPVLFSLAFGNHWSDAYKNYPYALKRVTALAEQVLRGNGNLWIAEAGQSDFSADLIRNLTKRRPKLNPQKPIHIVQHSQWNEEQTTPEKLAYVRSVSDYHKIPDGNAPGNGSPEFKTLTRALPETLKNNFKTAELWRQALAIADKYNGKQGRYNNVTIAEGGLDFSDTAEACWIFGLNDLANADDFFFYLSRRK